MSLKTKLLLSLLPFALASSASAISVYALGTDNHLYLFDTSNPAATTDIGLISQPGIVDIDFHAANGGLYGMTSTGATYGINLSNAGASLLINPGTSLSGVQDFDFNPAADRIRISAAGGVNLRMVPDFITAPSAAGTAGTIVNDGVYSGAPSGVTILANAYTNAFDTPAGSASVHSTALFSIGSDGILYSHATGSGAPAGSFGVMTGIGSGLGFAPGGPVGFDITADNQAWANVGSSLFSVNLTTGAFTSAGTIGAPISSLAAVPEASASALFAASAGLIALRRKRRA